MAGSEQQLRRQAWSEYIEELVRLRMEEQGFVQRLTEMMDEHIAEEKLAWQAYLKRVAEIEGG